MERRKILITIDVERIYKDSEKGVYDFLHILDKYGAKATFFITADILKNCPDIVKSILGQGHELASHSFRHSGFLNDFKEPYLDEIPHDEIDNELHLAKEAFKEYGVTPEGFRAPAFRVDKKILNAIGKFFSYDSSIVNAPLLGKKYKNWSRKPFFEKELLVLPVSNLNVLRIPLGAPYFLGLGAKKTISLVKFFGTTDPIIFYFHSFDFVRKYGQKLACSWFHSKWYYEKCGPHNKDFVEGLLDYFECEGVVFNKCIDFVKDFKNKEV